MPAKGGVFFPFSLGGVQSESGSIGEGKRRCGRAPQDKGAGGVHKGHFHIPGDLVVRGGRG